MKLNRMQLRRLINETVMQEAGVFSPFSTAIKTIGGALGTIIGGTGGAAIGVLVPPAVFATTAAGLGAGGIVGTKAGAYVAEKLGLNPNGELPDNNPLHPNRLVVAAVSEEFYPTDPESFKQYFKDNGYDPDSWFDRALDRPYYSEEDFKDYLKPANQNYSITLDIIEGLKNLKLINLNDFYKVYNRIFPAPADPMERAEDVARDFLGFKKPDNTEIKTNPEEVGLTDPANEEVEKMVKEMIRRNLRRL